jgi:catechol 2,3-dioxygenase-like lactoylglutathione lyase family enzyme
MLNAVSQPVERIEQGEQFSIKDKILSSIHSKNQEEAMGKGPLRVCIFLIPALIFSFTNLPAQSEWAVLDSPPAGTAPSGEVLRPGHLGREVGNVELIIHFYHDLIGLGLLGPRSAPRPFGSRKTNPALLEFVDLGVGVPNPMDARNRAVILPVPGTSMSGGPEMAIEAIEIKNIESRPYRPSMSDPGASYFTLIVRDLDKTLAVLKDELVPVITAGEEPVTLTNYPGMEGKIRAVFVRDPDGYPVGLMEVNPPPESAASPESNILGARISLVVDDLETTCRWFRHMAGPGLEFWLSPEYRDDKTRTELTGTFGRFRMAMALLPGSPVVMEFIEYKDHSRNFLRPHIQDPGTAHILFMSKDVDMVMTRLKEAGLHTLSKSNRPVFIGPTTRSFFVADPDGFWAEFMDHGVKERP